MRTGSPGVPRCRLPATALLVLVGLIVLGSRSTAMGGHWVDVFGCSPGAPSFTFIKSFEEMRQMALWPGTRIRFATNDLNEDKRVMISEVDSFPVHQLRKFPPQTLSHGGPVDAPGVDSGPYDSVESWSTPLVANFHAGADCGFATALNETAPQFRVYWRCNTAAAAVGFEPGIRIGVSGNSTTCYWYDHDPEEIKLALWQPLCEVPAGQWPDSSNPPVFDTAATGFYATDGVPKFRFSFDYHHKYLDASFEAVPVPELQNVTIRVSLPADTSLGECYNNIRVDVAWSDLVPLCFVDAVSNVSHVLYTCKVEASGSEYIDEFRGVPITRDVTHQIVLGIRIPQATPTTLTDFSPSPFSDVVATVGGGVAAVVTNGLSVAAVANLTTSVDYPLRFGSVEWLNLPTGISPGVAARLVSDCPDELGTCSQVWELGIILDGGANPAISVCRFTGDYVAQWAAECQPSTGGVCGFDVVPANKFTAQFMIVSGPLCALV